MSRSTRAKRMARNHRRMAQPARLNLVALMDIFTILVLFLIVNNSDVEVLQSDKRIALPDSISEQRPASTLIVKVTQTQILVGEAPVMAVEDALGATDETLAPLSVSLQLAALQSPLPEDELEKGRSIVIMGDQSTPYALLKRILATSADAGYRDVSLAVDSRPVSAEGAMLNQVAAVGSAQ